MVDGTVSLRPCPRQPTLQPQPPDQQSTQTNTINGIPQCAKLSDNTQEQWAFITLHKADSLVKFKGITSWPGLSIWFDYQGIYRF